jgi:ribosome-binding protein aMBF1 (putative translation factor)
MIRTDSEYQQARSRLLDEKKRLHEHEVRIKEMGLGPAEIKRAIDPLRSFTMQLQEEVEAYERMQRGSFEPIRNLAGVGRLLVAARVFRKLSQRDLARRLGVHESQVSRDERNEYRSITVERAGRILDVLGVELLSEMRPTPNGTADNT